MDKLAKARERISGIDREMAHLFEERMRAVADVAAYKQEHSLPVFDGSREAQVVERGVECLTDTKLRPYYEDFIRNAMAVSRRYQNSLLYEDVIGYQGVPGAYSHIALKTLFPDAKECAFATFEELCKALEAGEISRGILPFENSYAGDVGEVHDLLYRCSVRIVGVHDHRISHTLLGVPGTKLADIKRVYSHPQALEQCRRFVQSYGFESVPFLNTAAAAKMVSEEQNPIVAAIASPETAALYGLSVLAEDISTQSENTTRFVVLEQSSGNDPLPHGNRFSLMFTVDHAAGRLAEVIQVIARWGFNMECIRSRPLKNLPWHYYFYIEVAGDAASAEGQGVIEELHRCCREFKLLGSYTKAAE